MKHIRILFSLVAMLFISTTSRAQGAEVTYIHEDDIMNQFTVMELVLAVLNQENTINLCTRVIKKQQQPPTS